MLNQYFGASTGVPRALLLLLAVGVAAGCPNKSGTPATQGRLITGQGEQPLPSAPVASAKGTPLVVTFDNGMKLLGFVAPTSATRKSQIEVTLWFQATDAVSIDDGTQIFVHGVVPGGQLPALQGDHKPAGGMMKPSLWRSGDIIEDTFSVTIPSDFNADQVSLRVGFYNSRRRSEVKEGDHDGEHRVALLDVQVTDGPPTYPQAQAKKRTGPIVIDGKLDEPDWQSASQIGPFVAYDGRSVRKNKTFARLLWDDEALYVAFEAEDDDIHTPYLKRDDPLYDSEAVEIFIDADGDEDTYVELQAAPNDLHFDAAFKGGPRKNFDTSYDVNYVTKTTLDGSLNDFNDVDKGFVSEWRIPISEINDIPADRQPAAGVSWKINLFRLDRHRRGGRVVRSTASAWSSPFSGDFHNLKRFGTLVFVEK